MPKRLEFCSLAFCPIEFLILRSFFVFEHLFEKNEVTPLELPPFRGPRFWWHPLELESGPPPNSKKSN